MGAGRVLFRSPFRLNAVAGILYLMMPMAAIAQKSLPDFFSIHGKLVTHRYSHTSDSIQEGDIVELRDEKGIPVWFAQDVHRNVCATGECRKVDLRIYWDGAGQYLGFKELGGPLTKADHTHFDKDDYETLHRILSDSASVLKSTTPDDLLSERQSPGEKPDAISGATRSDLADYLVRQAAFTTHTLWHIVYGPTRSAILKILDERGNETYLKLLFAHGDVNRKWWALGFIANHPGYRKAFLEDIIGLTKEAHEHVSRRAMKLVVSDLNQPAVQTRMAAMVDELPDLHKFDLLWKLAELNEVEVETVRLLLEKFDQQKLEVRLLGYVYDLIGADKIKMPSIERYLKKFLVHDNLYVRTLTRRRLGM